MQENGIVLELDTILAIDYDKYVQRLLNYEPITREQAIKNIDDSLNYNEINTTEYRAELVANFDENNNWKVPSKEDKRNFPLWREDQFNILQKRFLNILNDSIMPLAYCKKGETKLVLDILGNELWSETMYNLVRQSIKQDLYTLAYVIGTIDHLKAVQKLTNKKIEKEIKNGIPAKNKTDYSNPSIAIAFKAANVFLSKELAAKALAFSENDNLLSLTRSRIKREASLIEPRTREEENTKHLTTLSNAKEFLKNTEGLFNDEEKRNGIAKIDRYIKDFNTKIEVKYYK